MTSLLELLRVGVKRDARATMPDLTRHTNDIEAGEREVRSERPAQIVRLEPRLSLRVESGAVGGLVEATDGDAPVTSGGLSR
jgi:hypothetical protein